MPSRHEKNPGTRPSGELTRQAKAGRAIPRRPLRAGGVRQLGPEHLVAAADADRRRALPSQRLHAAIDALLAHPRQVGQRRLRPRQHEQVGPAHVAGVLHVAHAHERMALERREVREVREPRQPNDGNVEDGGGAVGTRSSKTRGEGVLVVQVELHVGDDAEHGYAAELLELGQSGAKDVDVAAEFVDDEAAHQGALLRFKQLHRAIELREHAAGIDVAHEQHWRSHHAR